MVKVWGFWRRNEEEERFCKDVALTSENAPQSQDENPVEAIKQAERERQMIQDERVSRFIENHHYFNAYIPAFSGVNRTSKHRNKSEAEIMWLDFKILGIETSMFMPPEEYEKGALEIIQGFEPYISTLISDSDEGFKARILTEQRKSIRVETKK